MRLGKLAIATFVTAACAIGCGREARPRAPTTSAAVIGTARVDAGTMFTVRMIDPISSDTAVAGRVFTARLRDPLFSPNGLELAPAGAIVTGRVVSVQRGAHPRLGLSFDTIETYEGVAAIDTRAEEAMNVPFEIGKLRSAAEVEADVVLRPKEGGAGVGGGPPAEDAEAPSVEVPFDTELDLVLTKPLIIERTR